MRRGFGRWRLHLHRHHRQLSIAAGVGLIVGGGMAAFALLFDQSPLLLGLIAGIAAFLMILYYG